MTEIIASVLSLKDHSGPFFSNLLGIPNDRFSVSTQEIKEKLEGHDDASRVDMVARGQQTVIYVESKIASHEGTDKAGEPDQLKKYADHLSRESQDKKILLYITKWADPKNKMYDYCREHGSEFCQKRWFEVYQELHRLLTNSGPDPMIQQTLKFMENQKHSQKRNFSPAHIIAIQHRREAESLLGETVSEKFREEVCKMTKIRMNNKPRDWEDLNGNCYYAESERGGLGVCFPPRADSKDYPDIDIFIQFGPAEKNHVVEKEMRLLAENSKNEWGFYEWFEGKNRHISVDCVKSLGNFLASPDHVAAIETHLIGKLVELEPVWKIISKQN